MDEAGGQAAGPVPGPVPGQVPELLLTGERTLPGIAHENYWFRRHEAAYRFLLPWCVGAVVLEAGCGEGYGAHMISEVAGSVVGFDYDAATTAHLRRRYPRLHVVRGDLQGLPFADGSLEVVVNLQVIEHLWDQPGFLRECARILRPAGTLIVSTPNRLTFSPGRDTPVNPFHTRELAPDELGEMLGEAFEVQRMYGLHHAGRVAAADRRWHRRSPASPAYGSPFIDAQLATPPATWDPGLRRDVAEVRWEDFEVREGDVDRSLDLIAVATRRC